MNSVSRGVSMNSPRRLRVGVGRKSVSAASTFALLAAAFVTGVVAQTSAVQAAPGSPGVPSAPVTVFHEDFENVPGTTNAAQSILAYASAGGTTYTASESWWQTSNCNGIVANAKTTSILDCPPAFQPAFGAPLMEALGIENGSSDAKENYGLLEITRDANIGDDEIQVQTVDGVVTSESLSGRFVSFGITAASLCGAAEPVLTFSLLNDGIELPTGNTGVNPCSDPRGSASTIAPPGGGVIRVGTYFSSGSTLVGDAGDLGFIVRNTTTSGAGNDLAFDDITIVDATPQLDKEFVQDEAVVGQPTPLRFTVTNTSDLAAKNGWSFTDNMPAGLTVAGNPNASTTCAAGDITAAAGSATFSIAGGNIATGVSSCTVTVDVVADETGSISNGPANVTTAGLNAPGTSTIAIVAPDPSLVIDKTATLDDGNDNGLADVGEEITYGFTVTNNGNVPITGVGVNDDRVAGLTPANVDLNPTEDADFTADPYVVTEADLIGGGDIINTATASGTDPDDADVDSPEDSATTETGSLAFAPGPTASIAGSPVVGDTLTAGKVARRRPRRHTPTSGTPMVLSSTARRARRSR